MSKTPFEEAMEWGLLVPCLCDPKDKLHICPTKATNILASYMKERKWYEFWK